MHFAEVEGRFVAYEEFNTMLTPNTEIAHASHVFLRIYESIPNRLFFIPFNYFLRTCQNVWTFHCFHNILRKFVNKACYDGSLS